MLYEMAKRHDEWPGENYSGSSLRGAIHGWKHMGVCADEKWKYSRNPKKKGDLTLERVKDAKKNTLGAYYRLRPEIADYHAAINETGAIACSAQVHTGWENPHTGVIERSKDVIGGHAFAIVGYNQRGFWVQNSWGGSWGKDGLAIWTYEDWIENVMDGWVFQPALSTPQIFGIKPLKSLLLPGMETATSDAAKSRGPRRDEIAGHFVHIDDGKFAETGRYWSTRFDIRQTIESILKTREGKPSDKYRHVLFYGHGGLNSPKASARRISAMKQVFKDNGVYPFHIMYDTGLAEELKDLLLNKSNRAEARVGGFKDFLDTMTEHLVSKPGTLIWEEMKRDAAAAFTTAGAGTETLKMFVEAFRNLQEPQRKKIHLVGHSTGGILFAHLLKAISRHKIKIESCHLMAPACTIDLYHQCYLPVLQDKRNLKLGRMMIYNLKDELEQDDKVGSEIFYRKSLLYLVSNAFERDLEKPEPLLGMEKFKDQVKQAGDQPKIFYSNGITGTKSRSTTHGGFDNDVITMNYILKNILKGESIRREFTKEDLDY